MSLVCFSWVSYFWGYILFFLKTFLRLLGDGDKDNSAGDTGTISPPEKPGIGASETSLTSWRMGLP